MNKTNKTIVVANTKGGAGKSTVSTMILPVLFAGKAVNIYEIDNNNKTNLSNSSVINFKSIKIKHTEDALDDVYFDLISGEETINIVDCGGGDDTLVILNHIKNSDMDGLIYFVPVNDDIEQFINAQDTINAIKAADQNAKINLVLNRVQSLEEEEVKKQFVGFFGNEDYGIESQIEAIEGDIEDIYFIQNTTIFGILKNYYRFTLLDSYIQSKDLVDNIKTYRAEWGEDRAVFKKKMKLYRFAKDILELVTELQSLKKALK